MLKMATENELPKEFDVVVLGTGMPESIVAAAFSRIGQSVLHLDWNDHYSGDWASFNLQGIEEWAKHYQDGNGGCHDSDLTRPADESSLLEEGESLIQLPINNTNFSNAQVQYFVEEKDEIDMQSEKKESSDTKPSIICDKNEPVEQKDEAGGAANETSDTSEEKSSEDPENNDDACKKTEKEEENVIERKLQELAINDNEQREQSQVETDKAEGKIPKEETEKIPKEETEATESEEGAKDTKLESEKSETEMTSLDSETVEKERAADTSEIKKPERKWTATRLKAEWRKFNLDLSPKVLYSVGDMVELLISSDIAKYCEFKTITQIITLMNGNLEKVPCSRADVFSSKRVSMLEKRMLMKFLQFCLQYENKPEEIGDFLEKPFSEFLAHRKLTPTIKHYIQHSIAMATDSMTTREGLEKMQKFLKSLGRYGNTAFLWSLYGSGELPQSFCRMCAVFGGVYCLRMSASSMVMDSQNRCCAVVTTAGQKIKCKWLVMEGSYAPAQFICPENKSRTISRAIVLANKPLLTTDQQEQLSMMNLPCPEDGDRPITMLELPPSSMAAPPSVYVYHLTRKGKDGVLPKDDLEYAVKTLFSYEENLDDNKPSMLWSLYFTQKDMSEAKASDSIPENVVLMTGPGTDIDIDGPVLEAKEVFKRILPEEEFLPKAPNPEDIIYVDDSEAQVADASDQSEFAEKNDKDTNQSETEQSDRLVSSETDQSERGKHESETVDQSECSEKESSQSKDSLEKEKDIQKTETSIQK